MNTKRHGITFAAGCLLLVSALAVFLSGCALTVDKVKLDYVPQTGVQKVALKEPVRVDVGVVDIRSKKDRVSSKKNGYGMEMAAIVAENDVADVVANAIVAELRSRGFEIGQGHVIVNAELQKFYNDFKVGFFSGDAEAEVVINTKVRGVDKTVRFAKVVAGEGKEPNIQLSSGENAKLALDRALADAIARLFSDPAFVDALIYRPDGLVSAREPTSTPITAKVDKADAARGLVQEPPPNPMAGIAHSAVQPNYDSGGWSIKPIQDTKNLAGTWTGTATLPGGPAVPVTMVLRVDGSYETTTPSTRLVGSYGITGGRARYRSTTSGRTGTFELRERDGQQLLVIIIDGGGWAELRPTSK